LRHGKTTGNIPAASISACAGYSVLGLNHPCKSSHYTSTSFGNYFLPLYYACRSGRGQGYCRL